MVSTSSWRAAIWRAARLNPVKVAKELRNMRHAPPYASDPTHVEALWRIGRDAIAPALEAVG
jgi:hypothetical protein